MTIRQRLITTDDGKSPTYRRVWDGPAEALITCAQGDGARASLTSPGVYSRVTADGYYYVSEYGIDGGDRVIARGHLDPARWTESQLHHIHAGQCPAMMPLEAVAVGAVADAVAGRGFVTHCGSRIDPTALHAPFCDAHQPLTEETP